MTFVCYDGSLGTIMINNENTNVILQFISVSVGHSVGSLILLESLPCEGRVDVLCYN